MQDPFRPNSNAQLMREAQIGFIVVGLLLCVLVYVAFYRLTNRSSRFDEIARNVAVAEPIDSDPYQAYSVVQLEQKQKQKERFGRDRKGAFAAIEESSSIEKPSGLQQSSPSENVAQVNHLSSHSFRGSIKKPASTPPLPSPRVAASGFAPSGFAPSGFTPVSKHIPKVSRPFESPSGRSGRTDLGVAKESNTRKLPKKQPKVEPPVLESKFGGTPSQDFLPTPVLKKVETKTKTDPTSFEASPPLPTRIDANSAWHIPPKPKSKPPVPDSIDKVLTGQLPNPPIKDQSNDLMPQRSTSRKQLDSRKIDFGQPDESSFIAQTSAFEPIKAVSTPLPEPSAKREKISAKVGQTYATKKGDSLWTIAQTVYGDGRYFRALHKMNHDTLSLSESIPAGTLLKVSTIEELQTDYPELCPKQENDRHSQDDPHAADTFQTLDDENDQRFYLTEDGDTLFEIARQRLGQASRYLEIYELNRFRIPETANHLTPLGGGIQLLLPQ